MGRRTRRNWTARPHRIVYRPQIDDAAPWAAFLVWRSLSSRTYREEQSRTLSRAPTSVRRCAGGVRRPLAGSRPFDAAGRLEGLDGAHALRMPAHEIPAPVSSPYMMRCRHPHRAAIWGQVERYGVWHPRQPVLGFPMDWGPRAPVVDCLYYGTVPPVRRCAGTRRNDTSLLPGYRRSSPKRSTSRLERQACRC